MFNSPLRSHKQPVVEPKASHQFPLAIEDFYQKVKDPGKEGGAVFFAVCRGKVLIVKCCLWCCLLVTGE
jgi:hypothetical protein